MFEDDTHRIPTMAPNEDVQKQSLRPIVVYVVANTPPINTRQLQNIVFYLDSIASEEFLDKRLTKVEWDIHEDHVTTEVIEDVVDELLSEFNVEHVTVKNVEDVEPHSGSLRAKYFCGVTDKCDVSSYFEEGYPDGGWLSASWSPFTEMKYFTEFMRHGMNELGFDVESGTEEYSGDKEMLLTERRGDDEVYVEWLSRHPANPHTSEYDRKTTLNSL